ncbi:MAG TPA: metallopeptidase TldD-related protein [Gemmatimonadaceae bacterium]|nr:metallopeptidase TldD-related protein [Gemmatimonadaceae bacterium]
MARFAQGGGETIATIFSEWRGNVRWGRNRITTSGESRLAEVTVHRYMGGGNQADVEFNDLSDPAFVAAVRQAERLAQLTRAVPESDLITHFAPEPITASPALFFDATYQLDAGHRAAAVHHLAQAAVAAGMLSAGYIEVSAHSMANITSWGYVRYFQYTWARYSVTVRDPQGTGSGWVGVDGADWSRIDGPTLSALALEKCLTSRHPVAIEPGRYTTILEPQAVCDFVGQLVYRGWVPVDFGALDRVWNEGSSEAPFNQRPSRTGPFPSALGVSQLGARVVDERITISADPMDPECGFPPFDNEPGRTDSAVQDNVYHAATWIEHGVLTNLAYSRAYGQVRLGLDTGLPKEGAFRMSGGTTSMAEMIATTPRGLLVTRFDTNPGMMQTMELKSLLLRGYTRDGLWLIEHGRIAKPVQNMEFTESILFALNNVEQLGVPQRTFHPPGDWIDALPQPVIVPPLKIRDFSFTALSGAI